ncbi:MAG: hypothetical protein HUK24_05990 [Sphaerochaetaceae bacterium]|nr:hypothetical protein [Sphaerochaetaceae bacterium]
MIQVEPEVEKRIIKLHFEERRTLQSLADEFGLSDGIIKRIIYAYKKKAEIDNQRAKELANMKEIAKLKEENEELKKEVDFLKKAAAFFARESK